MSKDPQKLKALADNQIRSKIQEFNKLAKQQIYASQNPEQLIKWFIQQVLHYNPLNVPRISLLKQSLRLLEKYAQNKKFLNTLFIEQQSIIQFILQAEHMVDIAFVLIQHLQRKIFLKTVQYSSKIMQAIHAKMTFFFQQKKQKLQYLLRVNHVFSFIHFKYINPSQIYTNITQFQLQQLQQQVFIMLKFLIKPWLQKRTPRQFYYELLQILYWNMIIQDDNVQKQTILIKLNEKITNYLCCGQSLRMDGFVNYNKTIQLLFDSLAVNYRKQDPFKFYGFAVILNVYESQLKKDQIRNWIQYKGKGLKPNQIQNIFRNTFHIGSNIFTFNLIEDFSHVLKQKKQYNILYHLYLSFIKKDFFDVVLPNQTFLPKYFEILQFYVIGFINQERLDGQSQLDKLTYNLSSCLLRRKFNFRKNHNIVILFYKVYETRFSLLSSVSRRFLLDLQRFYRSNIDLADIHNKIDKGIFRDAGLSDPQHIIYEQLNIKRTDRYRGLKNLGNTCYMNSFMQALFMTKKFRSTILEIRDDKTLSSDKIICYSLINLFTQMMTKNIFNDQQVYPDLFKTTIPEPFRYSPEQHDVGQFGRMYFEALTNELNDDTNKERIQKIFFNKINKSIKCLTCKNEKISTELIFDFIVHLNKEDQSISVSKLLSQQFQGQQMSGDNKVYCQKCKRKTNTFTLPHPLKFAQYLIITIGLFEYSGGGKKIKKPFNFQFNLNLNRILPNESNISDQLYQLYAFIVHIGNQSQSGHYICYARNLQQNPTTWYCFDDSYVTERQIEKVSDFQFGQSETPYLLFYSTSKRRKSLSIN